MKARYSNILMLLAAICAFVPVLAVDLLLDNYVRGREQAELQRRADTVAARVQASAYDTITALRKLLAQSPSLCTPDFVSGIHDLMEDSLYLRQVLVENNDGVQYCDGLGRDVHFSPLSQTLSVPGRTETLTVVKFANLAAPALRITQTFGDNRRVSAFASVLADDPETLTSGLDAGAMIELGMTDGASIVRAGDVAGYDHRGSADYLSAEAFAGDLPLRVTAAIPFASVRADYADLDASFTILTCVMCGAFLILALRYVRRSDLPAFDLERAINAGEIKPYYQPVINLRTGALSGCEVLCRWEKKNGEVVQPGVFIEYAESSGLAIPMTLSLMQQTRADLSELSTYMPDLKISINLFEGHFRDATIVEDVHTIFANCAISFRQMVFEITERHPLDQHPHAASVIGGLHALGARLAMDDAGTGHSNLAYMQTLGVDVIKIDRVFVDMVKPGVQQVPVLDGLINMARELGTDIVAEGVETEEQAIYLRSRGVVMAQGYLFAPPLRAIAFKELARALHPTDAHQVAIDAPAEEEATAA